MNARASRCTGALPKHSGTRDLTPGRTGKLEVSPKKVTRQFSRDAISAHSTELLGKEQDGPLPRVLCTGSPPGQAHPEAQAWAAQVGLVASSTVT